MISYKEKRQQFSPEAQERISTSAQEIRSGREHQMTMAKTTNGMKIIDSIIAKICNL